MRPPTLIKPSRNPLVREALAKLDAREPKAKPAPAAKKAAGKKPAKKGRR